MPKVHVTTTINGEPMEFLCEPYETMLDALRGQLGLTGSKEGCRSGDCGACSVTVDGRLVCSCLITCGGGRRPHGRDYRGHDARAGPASASAEIFGTCSAAVRLLHSTLPSGTATGHECSAAAVHSDRG